MSSHFTINAWVLIKTYDSEKIKDEEKRGRDYKRFEIIDNKKQEPECTEEKVRQKCKNHYRLK